MLNQISKLKGNEIFSLVTPDGTDEYIISKDLIGNVLNVVEDMYRKKKEQEKPPVPFPIQEFKEIKRLSKEANAKACMALLNSSEAMENTSKAVAGINDSYRISREALQIALKAQTIADKVNSFKQILDGVAVQTNLNVEAIRNLQDSQITQEYVDSEVSNLSTSVQQSLNQLSNLIRNQIERVDTLDTAYAETITKLGALSTLVQHLADTNVTQQDLQDLDTTLRGVINQLSQKEANDVRTLQNDIATLNTQLSTRLDQEVATLNNTITETFNNLEVSIEQRGTEYRVKQGGRLIGTIEVSGGTPITVDSEVSDESENPIQNQAITNFILEKDRVIAEALTDLNNRVTALEESVAAIEENVNQLQETQNSNEIPYYTVTYLDSVGDGLEKIDLIPKNSRFYLSEGGSSVDYYTLTDIKMNGVSIKNDSQYVTDNGQGFTIEIPNVTGPLVIDYHYVFINPPTPPIFDFDDENKP